jgi:hypothetical protein
VSNTLAYFIVNLITLCYAPKIQEGSTKEGSITVPLISCLNGLESDVWQLTFFLIAKRTNPNQSNRRSTVQ